MAYYYKIDLFFELNFNKFLIKIIWKATKKKKKKLKIKYSKLFKIK